MATIDRAVGGTNFADGRNGRCFVLTQTYDPATDAAVTSADTLQMLSIPANTWVLAVHADVTTAEGSALTALVGDVADPNGWIASLDLNAVAVTFADGAYNNDVMSIIGHHFPAASVISLTTISASITTAVFSLRATCIQFDVND